MKKVVLSLICISILSANTFAQSPSETEERQTKIYFIVMAAAVIIGVPVLIMQKKKEKNEALKKKKEEERKAAEAEMIAKLNSLSNQKIKESQVTYADKGSAPTAPGQTLSMIIKAVLEDGREFITEGAGNGKTTWDNYTVEVEGGTFSNGVLTINEDPGTITDHKVKFKAAVASDPSLKKELEITLQYDANIEANFSGSAGRSGEKGQRGRFGARGNCNGGDGTAGDNGESGRTGEDLDVYATVVKDKTLGKDLLYVKINGAKYVIDPLKAKIAINASGGAGGKGGKGGNGGDGSHDAQCNGSLAGNGGNGGNGGDGGDGGKITLHLDPSVDKYAASIISNSLGGHGGNSGSGGSEGFSGSGGSGYRLTGKPGKDGRTGRDGRNGVIKTIKESVLL